MKTTKTILSLLLALALAASLGAMPVFADDENIENVENLTGDAKENVMPYTVEVTVSETGTAMARFGDEAVPGDKQEVNNNNTVEGYNGVNVTYTAPEQVPTFTVDGPIETTSGQGLTVVNNSANTPVTAVVEGSVTGADGGVSASNTNPALPATTVEAKGDVNVTTTGAQHAAVYADNSTVNVHGSVVNNSNTNAIQAKGSSASVTVDKDVTSKGEDVAAVSANNGAEVTVKGSVTSITAL